MTCEISLEGLLTVGGNEERALADIKVTFDDKVYDWKIFIPPGANLNEFLESSKDKIAAEIEAKEAEWEALDPKTRTLQSPFGEDMVIDINKDEIVRPSIPDYYAQRRNEYPSLSEQLGAIWKGEKSEEFAAMKQKILDVKAKYPKS
jgi:hypothetical protein